MEILLQSIAGRGGLSLLECWLLIGASTVLNIACFAYGWYCARQYARRKWRKAVE